MAPNSVNLPIAVVLPVYNGEKYLEAAITSVLRQTFRDFELVVVDDGSSDCTVEIVRRFSDRRVRLICLEKHQGIVGSLNAGIRESRSEFIARMDADDVSLPLRFERQIAFLKAHPTVGICGTLARDFGDRQAARSVPTNAADIRARLFFGWAMDHPTLMIRRSIIDRHTLSYREGFRHAEDLDLLMRAAEITDLANVPEVLLLYRIHRMRATTKHEAEQNETVVRLLQRQLRMFMPHVTSDEEAFHIRVALSRTRQSELSSAEGWLLWLRECNRKTGRYDNEAFERELRRRWYLLHRRGEVDGLSAIASYWTSPLSRNSRNSDIGLREHLALTARCLLRPLAR